MDPIGSIIGADRFEQSPEIAIIKSFIEDKFSSPAEVSVGAQQIIIVVPGAALAGALRFKLQELQKLLKTDKKLLIRIGH
jgi:hypothetical protein